MHQSSDYYVHTVTQQQRAEVRRKAEAPCFIPATDRSNHQG